MASHIGRRKFLATLGGAAAAWPLAARAQQTERVRRIGIIQPASSDDAESIPALISDLLRAKVDIIVVGGTAALRAAQTATQSIPIVMGAVSDPLGRRERPRGRAAEQRG